MSTDAFVFPRQLRSGETPHDEIGLPPKISSLTAKGLPVSSNWFERQLVTKKSDAPPPGPGPSAMRADLPGTVRPYQ